MSKVVRPDKNAFEKEFNSLKEKLGLQQAEHKKHNDALRSSQSTKNDPEWQKLLDELKVARGDRDAARGSVQGVQNEIRTLDAEYQKKVREIANLRPKSGPKSDEEFARAISNLEKQVESGSMKLVDEKKTIKEIGYLKTARRSIAGIPKLESEVQALKAQIAEKRKTIDDSKLKEANARIDAAQSKLDARKAERKESYNAKNLIWEARKEADAQIKSIRSAMDAARKEFNAKYEAYKEATAEERRQKAEEERAQKEQAARARKLKEAEDKLEAAKESAFAPQIAKAQTLIDYFAPWAPASTAAAPKTEDVGAAPAGELAQVSIQKAKISAPPSRKELKRKQNNRNEKLRLDLGVVESLSTLNIPIPKDTKEAAEMHEKLQAKIEYYKSNDERVTKEKVERAEQALEKVKAQLAESETAEADAPVSADAADAPAATASEN